MGTAYIRCCRCATPPTYAGITANFLALEWPETFRGRKVVSYVDNTSALACFVKGASGNRHLERIVGLLWVLAYHLSADIWLEWVDSKSNWADKISRLFGEDPLSRHLGFRTRRLFPDTSWWDRPWIDVWRAAQDRTQPARL